MSLNQYTQKIDRYLSKNEGLPIVVDVQNEADQIELVLHPDVFRRVEGEEKAAPLQHGRRWWADKYAAGPVFIHLVDDRVLGEHPVNDHACQLVGQRMRAGGCAADGAEANGTLHVTV